MASVEGYISTVEELYKLEPKESDVTISIKSIIEDGETYYDVSGLKQGDEQKWAIEFSEWEEWLGMGIDESSIKEFGEIDFVCHCLYEMTFTGYSNKEVKEQKKILEELSDEAEEAFKSGDMSHFVPIEDLFKDLEND